MVAMMGTYKAEHECFTFPQPSPALELGRQADMVATLSWE